jgi:hypothetical protein
MHSANLVWSGALLGAALFLAGQVQPCRAAAKETEVSVVTDATPGAAALHGLGKLAAALDKKGIVCEKTADIKAAPGKLLIVAGLAKGDGPAAKLLKDRKQTLPQGPEALLIYKTEYEGKPAWVIAGADDRGLMYAELDVAERVGWSTERAAPLSEVHDTVEKPAVSERALSLYTMNRACWEKRFYDEAYWTRYLDMLAQNRFNSLVVIFGYENGGFLAPPYPYFFDVEDFTDVRMVDLTAEQQKRNLEALNRLIKMAHDRGLRVTLGLWDHIYRGGVQSGGVPEAREAPTKPTPGFVWGVTEKNLVPYTKAALAKLIRAVPDIDAIQFRMHDESGLKNSEQEDFWRDVFQMLKEKAPNLRIDARAKGLPDSVIQSALDKGVKLRVTTKYWMEQMGLPFHPTHINKQNQLDRRHSYADLLRYPQKYQMQWRLWNSGTSRILLWGDPEYVRRFADSTHLYDGDGFEVNEPLATKMEAQPHDAKPFDLLKPAYRYYDYEFERYWHFFQVFGRVGYKPDTPAEVWQREFEKRFGKEAAPSVEKGLHRASWILPRIVASCYPYSYFPTTRGWVEKQRLGDLPNYAKAEGSDIQQFASFDEEAQLLMDNGETAKCRPPETSRWLARAAEDIQTEIAAAEKSIGTRGGKEFDSTMVDLKILANLALFHSRRIPAGVSYCLFQRTHDPKALDEAITYEGEAIAAWRKLVEAADDVYAEDLMMGARSAELCGHWRDELAALEKGLAALERQRKALPATEVTKVAPRYRADGGAGEPPVVVHKPITTAPAGKPLTITAMVRAPTGVKWVRLRYRGVNQQLDYQTLPLEPTGKKDEYQAVVPAEQVAAKWDFMYFFEVMDKQGNGRIYPDFNRETPYIVVRLVR